MTGFRPAAAPNRSIAYLVSRFPSTTETFIAREMNEVARRGADIELYSLIREDGQILQPESARWLPGLTAGSDLGPLDLVRGQLHWLRRRPGRLIGAWARAFVGNLASPGFLLRALVVIPVAAAFARRMEEDGIEHVHAHWATHPALGAYVINRLTDLPYSVSIHAHDLYVDQSMLAEKLDRADFVATISAYNRGLLSSIAPSIADRCHVVRCGVASDAEIPAGCDQVGSGPESGGDDGPIRVLCVAQFKPYKGQRNLVIAIYHLVMSGVDVHATFVGDGPDLQVVQDHASMLGLDQNTDFMGAVESSRIPGLLAGADLFVAPSVVQADGKADGIPVAVMEAMSAGVPVVASDVTGMSELVEHEETGLLVAPEAPVALADAILRLASDADLRSRVVAGARRLLASDFDVSMNGGRLAELLGLSALPLRPSTAVLEPSPEEEPCRS